MDPCNANRYTPLQHGLKVTDKMYCSIRVDFAAYDAHMILNVVQVCLVHDIRLPFLDRGNNIGTQELALARLADFAYIGLTDHWKLSVCLWEAMFETNGPLNAGTHLANVRASPLNGAKTAHQKVVEVLKSQQFTDDADDALWASAVRMARRDIATYLVGPYHVPVKT